MPPASSSLTPGLASFLRSVPHEPVETAIESLIALLKRRQIQGSRPCALATAWLLRRVISTTRAADSEKLLKRIHDVGRRLVAAQPRELVVGNIVRRVLGLIREEAEGDRADGDTSNWSSDESRPPTPAKAPTPSNDAGSPNGRVSRKRGFTETQAIESFPSRPPLLSSHTTAGGHGPVTSMFSLLSHPDSPTTGSPGTASPAGPGTVTPKQVSSAGAFTDLRAEIIEGIGEIIDELDQADEQIASYALDHIHSNEVILTHTSSLTVQRFLLKAATKRKFTVIHAETYPNNHHEVHASITGSTIASEDDLSYDSFSKPLTSAGITVILIPDSAVFALMSRVNKVILGTHAVLANGGLIAAAGAKVIAKAARVHRTPVVVVSGIFKLCPSHPFDPESYLEYGDVSKVFPYQDGSMVGKVDVENPLFDFVPPDLVDLYITNLGGHAPSYLYRIVQDHYRDEDIEL